MAREVWKYIQYGTALRTGNIEVSQWLMVKGFSHGTTQLHDVARIEFDTGVKPLIDEGAPVNDVDDNGQTALYFAVVIAIFLRL